MLFRVIHAIWTNDAIVKAIVKYVTSSWINQSHIYISQVIINDNGLWMKSECVFIIYLLHILDIDFYYQSFSSHISNLISHTSYYIQRSLALIAIQVDSHIVQWFAINFFNQDLDTNLKIYKSINLINSNHY